MLKDCLIPRVEPLPARSGSDPSPKKANRFNYGKKRLSKRNTKGLKVLYSATNQTLKPGSIAEHLRPEHKDIHADIRQLQLGITFLAGKVRRV